MRRYLEAGEQGLDPRWQALIGAVLRAKAHAWTDALSAGSRLHLDTPENWDPNEADGWVPMEPFGYNFDDKKLGFLNECIYGCNLLAEAALMQFHPLGNRALLYSGGPVRVETKGAQAWSVRSLGSEQPVIAGIDSAETDQGAWRMTGVGESSLSRPGFPPGWHWFGLPPQSQCTIQREARRGN